MLTPQAIKQLQQVFKEEYGRDVSVAETQVIGERLIHLYRTVLTDQNGKIMLNKIDRKPKEKHL